MKILKRFRLKIHTHNGLEGDVRAKMIMVILKELIMVEKETNKTVVDIPEHLATQYLLEDYIL